MVVIFKYALSSIRDKKARAALIIIAIMLSATLLFVSVSLSDTLIELYKERMRQISGTAELMVTSNDNDLLDKEILNEITSKYKEQYDYAVGIFNYKGVYKEENKEISLLGINLEDLEKYNSITLDSGTLEKNLESDEIIISNRTAARFNINLGDEIVLNLNKVESKYKVSGIAQNKGLFLDESEQIYSIVDHQGLNEKLNINEKYNIIFLKTNSRTEILNFQKELQQAFTEINVDEPFTIGEIENQVNRIAMPLMLVTIVISLISIYIIYSSFKVITLEKLSIIGVFRSVGASKSKANQIFIIESIIYGLIGGTLACAFGIGILYLVSYISLPEDIRVTTNIKLNLSYIRLIATMGISIFISLISCLMPIFKVSSNSIKSIIFNEEKYKKSLGVKGYILGLVFVVGSIILPRIVDSGSLLVISMISIILAIVGIVILVEPLLKLMVNVLSIIFKNTRKGVVNMSLNNVLTNESIINSIRLLAIGIATLLMINTISSSVGTEVLNFYKNIAKYDLEYKTNFLDEDRVQAIQEMNDIESVMPIYQGNDIGVVDHNDTISLIESVDKDRFTEYWNIVFYDDIDELFSKLEEGDNIILTTILRDRYNLSVGDEIILEFAKNQKTFKIIGFVYTLNENGSYALTSNESAKNFFDLSYYSDLYVNLKEHNYYQFEKELKNTYGDEEYVVNLKDEVTEEKMNANKQLFTILSSVSILALIIGIIGISNNQIISYFQRRKFLAIFRSIGMNKTQIAIMLLIESIITGIIGGIIGNIAGYIMITIVPFVMKGIKLPIPLHINYQLFIIYLFGALIIIIMSSIIPMIKEKKATIIESIKYE
ncbi:FtsX-like permease family protein [Clostridium paraputrificum]|uniref:ABC transporter permease n=1 Tax=Clostridium paraputrificum TaxID=29363 RepID=UPI003D334AAF